MIKLPKKKSLKSEIGSDPLPRENPFRGMVQMLKSSIGRLPTHLVVIFVAAATIAVLCGLIISFAGRNKDTDAYLPLRVVPAAAAAPLADQRLKGFWAAEKPPYIFTLRMSNGGFEIVVRTKDAQYSRYYIRGGYRSEGNVLILQQRKDMGAASEPGHEEIKFFALDFSNINLYAELNNNAMKWSVPESEKKHLKRRNVVLDSIFGSELNWIHVSDTP